jgi:NitT/TauT family transport system ATP-binding protein
LLAGLLHPREGQIFLSGASVARPRRDLGLVLQDHGLLPWATVWDNVALGMKIRGIAEKQYGKAITAWLDRLGLSEKRDSYPSQLSGGQRQRVAIARTLICNPDLLLLDEPFSSLDALTRESLQDLLLMLNQDSGRTTIIVTHDITEAVFLAKRIAVLKSPPTSEFVIVENPGAGSPAYRQTDQYQRVCTKLRGLMSEHRSPHSEFSENPYAVHELLNSTA